MSFPLPENNELVKALQIFSNARYRAGLENGLLVAEKIVGWLTRRPDTKWQRETRTWAIKAIKEAKKEASDG